MENYLGERRDLVSTDAVLLIISGEKIQFFMTDSTDMFNIESCKLSLLKTEAKYSLNAKAF